MGKGDRRTRRGKIWIGSTGNTRSKSGRKKKRGKGKSIKRTPSAPPKA
jgi:ribosomal small subunit protein bTHX